MTECLKYIEHLLCQVEESREKPNKKKFPFSLNFQYSQVLHYEGKKSLGVIIEKPKTLQK